MQNFRVMALMALLGAGWLVAGVLWWSTPAPTGPASPLPPVVLEEPQPTPAAEEIPETLGESEPEMAADDLVETSDPLGESKSVDQVLAKWENASGFQGATIGFSLLQADGERVLGVNDTLALTPASALKAFTAGAALELMGEDFVFETAVAATARHDDEGALEGNLLLKGGGDPTLHWDDLDRLAREVSKTGIKSVSGGVVAHAGVFPEAGASDHWNWGDVGNAYGAGAYGLNIGHNRYRVSFNPAARVGAPATLLGSTPEIPGVQWRNLVTTGPKGSGDGVMIHSGPYAETITLRGTVPAGEPGFNVSGSIPNPPLAAAKYFDQALRKLGIELEEEPSVSWENPSDADHILLAAHQSQPLLEIVTHMNAVSDNLEAQSVFLKAGGADAIRKHYLGRGVKFAGLRLEDGSGLARATRIRPLDLARALKAARQGPFGEQFRSSLTPTRGSAVRSKTGFMSGVRAEAGFLTTREGEELTFAVITNGLTTGANYWSFREELLRAATASLKTRVEPAETDIPEEEKPTVSSEAAES